MKLSAFMLFLIVICLSSANAQQNKQPEMVQAVDGSWFSLVRVPNADGVTTNFLGGIIKKIGTVPKPAFANFSLVDGSPHLIRVNCATRAELMFVLAIIRSHFH